MIETPDGTAIKARVRAVPENGAANEALITTIAKWLNVPKSHITLSAGGKSRLKILTIEPKHHADIDRIQTLINQLTSTQDKPR